MTMIGRTLVLLAAITATGVSARAGDNPLVGTWRLVSFDREIVATKELVHAFGGRGTGFSTYTPDGRYSSMVIDSTRPSPAQPTATDAEAISLYRTMNGYAGSYRIEGDRIVLHLDITWNQIENGEDTMRLFKVEGDRLTVTTPPQKNAFLNNQMVSARTVWERVK
jgi:hypothetical protein